MMERGLRDLVGRGASEAFRGVYLRGGLSATRKNVLSPGAIGVYSGGNIYNPSQVVRDISTRAATAEIDKLLTNVSNAQHIQLPIEKLRALLELTMPDAAHSERIWDTTAVGQSLVEFAKLHRQENGYVYVDRDRDLKANRRETQGILAGGEEGRVPRDKVTLFLLRTRGGGGDEPVWWPQIRFPDGQYAFAFAV
jgi:hypothetical protein